MNDTYSSGNPTLVNCDPPFSFFFDLISKEWHGNNLWPLHRICTLTRKMGVRCFVREELKNNAEIQAEETALQTRTGLATAKIQAIRLTFFRGTPPSSNWRNVKQEEILGYAMLATLTAGTLGRSYVLEAVVFPPSLFLNNVPAPSGVTNHYMHCCRSFETLIGPSVNDSKKFQIIGAFFCQQNDLTHVFAHAVLRMVINTSAVYAGEGYQ